MDEAGSSQADDEGFIPNAKEASDLVSQFAEITGTDTACAQFYLQDRDWDLQVYASLCFSNDEVMYNSFGT